MSSLGVKVAFGERDDRVIPPAPKNSLLLIGFLPGDPTMMSFPDAAIALPNPSLESRARNTGDWKFS